MMNVMKPVRPLVLALSLACLTLPATAPARDKAPTLRVAVLPVVNVSPEPLAVQTVSQALREQLGKLDASRATFLYPSDVQRILSAHNAMQRAMDIVDRWGKNDTLDSTAVVGLDTLLTVDAILCVRVTEWEVRRITVINAGQSYTTIGAQFALYDIPTKKLLWKKDARIQRFAPEYDVSSGTVSYDAIGNIQSRSTNEPPEPKEVANDLIRSAFKKFPNS
jgi:hypothetical protein